MMRKMKIVSYFIALLLLFLLQPSWAMAGVPEANTLTIVRMRPRPRDPFEIIKLPAFVPGIGMSTVEFIQFELDGTFPGTLQASLEPPNGNILTPTNLFLVDADTLRLEFLLSDWEEAYNEIELGGVTIITVSNGASYDKHFFEVLSCDRESCPTGYYRGGLGTGLP